MELQKTNRHVLHHARCSIEEEMLADGSATPSLFPPAARLPEKKKIRIVFLASPPGDKEKEYQGMIEEMVLGGLSLLQAGAPIVVCSFPHGGQLIKISCITESSPEIMTSSPDLLSFHLPADLCPSWFSIDRLLFSIDSFPGRTFLFIYNAAAFDDAINDTADGWPLEGQKPDERDPHLHTPLSIPRPWQLEFQPQLVCRQICLALSHPAAYRQMAAMLSSLPPAASHSLRHELVRWLSRHSSSLLGLALNEFQRLLLATDEEFHRIRTPSHLLKLVRSHLWLKDHHAHRPSAPGGEKWFYCRLFRSKLFFPFGTKEVISLVISLHSLSTYEQFDHRHILLACKRCLPSLEVVPRSFYLYRYSEEPTLSLYLEVEKNDGSLLTSEEMTLLKRDLRQELSVSIEQVMSRIDIPHNEEDLLRNFLLLSQQLRTTKDIPQVIIQFHGQTDISVEFHVTLVRCIKKGQEELPLPSAAPLETTRCLPLRSSVIDTLRTNHLKQGIVFSVECQKEHLLRRDRSVDFLQARESVVHCIETAFGPVRDLNGGLIYQHHQLLESIRPLLTQDEAKEMPRIETLFHSLSPTIMKNILGPEHVVTVFRQCMALRKRLHDAPSSQFLVEEYTKQLFLGFICPPSFAKEEIFAAQQACGLDEQALALCDTSFDGHLFCFVICLSQDKAVREKITSWLQHALCESRKTQEKNSLRLCLSRPIRSLDPRIGTDRMSGTVIKMLYEGLMRLDPSGNPTLAMAEEVLISDDGRTYTFTLRPSVWTDGSPVTAYDFEYAWKKILDPSFQTVFDYLLLPILNARLVKAGRLSTASLGIHAVSDTTLVVELEKPCPYFLELCCLWIYSPLCKDLDQTHPGWAYFGDRSYVGNGPFKLVQWDRNSTILLEKNDLYWDKEHVSIERINLKIIQDPLVALHLFERGEIDWLGEPLSETPLCLFKESHPHLHTNPMAVVQWYDFNTQHPPFRSSKVRRAFSYALNRSALIKEQLYGDERPSHSILPPSLSLLDSQAPLEFDLALARELFQEGMEEQGLADSILKPLRMVVYDREPHKSIARAVITAWEEAFGLSFVLDVVSWHEFFEGLGGSSHDILGHVWYSWYKDPLYSLAIFKSKTSGMNSSRWSNEEYAKLLDKAELELDASLRNSHLKAAEEMILDEMPVVPVFDYTSRYLKSSHVDNIYVSHLGNVDFKWATVAAENPPSAPLPPPSSDACPSPSARDEIHLYLQSEPLSLDPRIGGDKRTQVIIRELYEGLMRIGKSGDVEYGIAESVALSDDQKTYTFHLRPTRWSNGSEVTADDFVWTISRALSPDFSTPFAYAFFSINNAQKAHHGQCPLDDIGIVAKGPRTLEITLERPVPYFLELVANPIYAPVCKACDKTNPSWTSEVFPQYVCNGPYILRSHIRKSQILLEKNPYYWDPDGAKNDCLSFRIIKDPQEALHMFESGELDWYGDPFGNMSPQSFSFHQQKKKSLIQRQGGGISFLACRTDIPLLRSSKIRKAIAHAINRREICEAVYRTPAFSLLPEFMTLADSRLMGDHSPEIAVRLFEEGLAEEGLTLQSCPSLAISHWSDPTVKTAVKIIQRQLHKVLGLRVVSRLRDWTAFLERFVVGDFQLAFASWFAWFQDPIFTLQFLKHKGTGMNGTAWENPEYIRLLELCDKTQDQCLRKGYLKQAEALVMEELPVIPVFYQKESYIKAPEVTGEAVSPVGLMELKWLSKTTTNHIMR